MLLELKQLSKLNDLIEFHDFIWYGYNVQWPISLAINMWYAVCKIAYILKGLTAYTINFAYASKPLKWYQTLTWMSSTSIIIFSCHLLYKYVGTGLKMLSVILIVHTSYNFLTTSEPQSNFN